MDAMAQRTGSMVDMPHNLEEGSRKASVSGGAGHEQEFSRNGGGIASNLRKTGRHNLKSFDPKYAGYLVHLRRIQISRA